MRKLVIIFILGPVGMGFSQETGSIYLRTDFSPNSEVATIKKNSIGFDIPLKKVLNKESVFLFGAYQNSNIAYINKDVPFATSQIDNFHTFSVGLMYTRVLENDWGFLLRLGPQVSSNFELNDLNGRDIYINAALIFDKLNKEEQSMWSFGISYDAQNGLNFPIPVVAYSKRLDDKWAYKIGFPDSRLKWSFHKNHYFEAFTTLDGFAGNIQDKIEIYKDDYTGKLRNTTMVGGLGYAITFLRNFEFGTKLGYSFINTMEVQNYDSHEIYDFNLKNGFYYNFGLKLNLKSKTKLKSSY